MQQGTADDEIFGALAWRLESHRVVVSGDRIPEVTIVRTGADDPLPWIPIGTRRPELLDMTLAGDPVVLLPGPGRFSRRSYRVAVETTDGPLLSTPCSPTAARLVRGRSYRGDNELGIFERADDDNAVTCAWSSTVTALGVTVEALVPTPHEAAVGHALALAFGTGAQLLLPALGSALGRMIPG